MEKDQQTRKDANVALGFEFEPARLTTEIKTEPDLIEWKKEYSLGIKTIDDQHKMLFRMFTSIKKSIRSESTWATIHFSILELKELVLIHFAVEDALMELFGYPKISEHQRTHQSFLSRLDNILNISMRKTANKEMLMLLEEWQTKHILGDDRDYVEFILSGASIVRSKND
jgi:hemerythrin-like metal-binding protein